MTWLDSVRWTNKETYAGAREMRRRLMQARAEEKRTEQDELERRRRREQEERLQEQPQQPRPLANKHIQQADWVDTNNPRARFHVPTGCLGRRSNNKGRQQQQSDRGRNQQRQ